MKNDIANGFNEQQGDRVPGFAATWQAAQARHATNKTSYLRFASAAALMAAVLIGFNLQAPQSDNSTFIEVADLMESTNWSAPSDVLLPEHQFDIYQDMPVLIESTQTAGGSLL
jgi:hypothetical protein